MNRTWRGYDDVNLRKEQLENTGKDISLSYPVLHLYRAVCSNVIPHDSHWNKQEESQTPFIL